MKHLVEGGGEEGEKREREEEGDQSTGLWLACTSLVGHWLRTNGTDTTPTVIYEQSVTQTSPFTMNGRARGPLHERRGHCSGKGRDETHTVFLFV
jgi:hypothetical protein